MKRDAIVTEARSWIGTKWQHQASLKGVACDCVGLVRGVYTAVTGLTPDVPLNYPATWHLFKAEERLYNECTKYLEEIAPNDALPGDVLLFGFGKGPACHVGIMTGDDSVIHSWMDVGQVTETRLSGYWEEKTKFAFRYPGVDD
jgi:NlpC/P60 family putative phage cell wall peptidase